MKLMIMDTLDLIKGEGQSRKSNEQLSSLFAMYRKGITVQRTVVKALIPEKGVSITPTLNTVEKDEKLEVRKKIEAE